ncbi:MAG: hypothetical protein FWG50_07785 [Kiritimatiellaeota bacterium]|nr:hypothetical protein [Kiritimatiellota bacterium]
MSLSCWCYMLGLITVLGAGAVLALPQAASRALNALPRNAVAGYVLSAVAWIWAGYAVHSMDLDIINPYKQYLFGVVPVCMVLTCLWMGNLLPCRAIGGILALFPHELLYTARSHLSAWRLVLVVLAYVAVIEGMVFILYPWKLRQMIVWFTARPALLRAAAALKLLLGLLLIALGATALK